MHITNKRKVAIHRVFVVAIVNTDCLRASNDDGIFPFIFLFIYFFFFLFFFCSLLCLTSLLKDIATVGYYTGVAGQRESLQSAMRVCVGNAHTYIYTYVVRLMFLRISSYFGLRRIDGKFYR